MYSTTLLPGEQVRLATTDRRSRFSFDSESKLSYRSEQNRINKTETMKLELVSIERRVIDPVALMPVPANPVLAVGNIASIPQEVPATAEREAALAEVDAQLVERGLIDKAGGKVSTAAQKEFGYERRVALPTAGVTRPRPRDPNISRADDRP